MMEPMEFLNMLEKDLRVFISNMERMFGCIDLPKEDWMKLFLSWLEWKTDEHNAYWEDTNV